MKAIKKTLASAAVATLVFSGTGMALADSATAGPKAKSGTYLVTSRTGGTINVRSTPGVANNNKVGSLHHGARVRVYCTAYDKQGQLWDAINKAGTRLVIDRAVRTGTSKPVAPRCSSSGDREQALAEAQRRREAEQRRDLELMEEMRRKGGPAPDEFNYHFHLPVGNLDPGQLGITPESITTDLVTNFDAVFPYSGCGQHIRPDQVCNLDVYGFDSPIRINQIWSNGFRLTSLPGHPEGPDRTLTFEFQQDTQSRLMYLDVTASGPTGPYWSSFSGNWVTRGISKATVTSAWPAFAYDVGRRHRLNTLDHYLDSLQGR